MGNVVVSQFITVDGVIESPGPEPGFVHAGWAFQFDRGPEGDRFKLEELRAAGALLLGRVTYEGFARAWPAMEGTGEFGEKMNSLPKYVVSSTLTEVGWNNSQVIAGDLPDGVARLKEDVEGDILVYGSALLVQALVEHDLVDEYRLMVYPVVLGVGKRLFAEASHTASLRATGIQRAGDAVILTYQRAETSSEA
jgi:dihydrofolate reductase